MLFLSTKRPSPQKKSRFRCAVKNTVRRSWNRSLDRGYWQGEGTNGMSLAIELGAEFEEELEEAYGPRRDAGWLLVGWFSCLLFIPHPWVYYISQLKFLLFVVHLFFCCICFSVFLFLGKGLTNNTKGKIDSDISQMFEVKVPHQSIGGSFHGFIILDVECWDSYHSPKNRENSPWQSNQIDTV